MNTIINCVCLWKFLVRFDQEEMGCPTRKIDISLLKSVYTALESWTCTSRNSQIVSNLHVLKPLHLTLTVFPSPLAQRRRPRRLSSSAELPQHPIPEERCPDLLRGEIHPRQTETQKSRLNFLFSSEHHVFLVPQTALAMGVLTSSWGVRVRRFCGFLVF